MLAAPFVGVAAQFSRAVHVVTTVQFWGFLLAPCATATPSIVELFTNLCTVIRVLCWPVRNLCDSLSLR